MFEGHKLDMASLLGREEVVFEKDKLPKYVSGKTVIVTGGGGSIGSELCRQLCNLSPAKIVIFDIYENDAYMLCNELCAAHKNIESFIEIGNICDMRRVDEIFEKHKPHLVFHAAAHKHVPLMEYCPREAIQNNVFGTLNVAKVANKHNVERFVFISTDKAVNPSSVMGATKRAGEMVVQYFNSFSETIYSAVRFGNVLGSHGSVIPLFLQQIETGGPVSVTHPDMERFFMTIPEASRLVLMAGGAARGGEVFILDMGEPIKILDLATKLISIQGLVPGEDIQIKFSGIREGEKLSEELYMDSEHFLETENKRIRICAGQEIDKAEFAQKIDALKDSIDATDKQAIRTLQETVKNFTRDK